MPSPLSFSLLGAQILANVCLYLCAIMVGVMSYYMADRKHRKAFLEARQSLEVKMNLEEQSQQQVRSSRGGHAAMQAWSPGPATRAREGPIGRGWAWDSAAPPPPRPQGSPGLGDHLPGPGVGCLLGL